MNYNMYAFGPGDKNLQYDVLIVGGGLSGIYSLYRMRKLGLRVKVLEAGSSEGGTWFWWVPQLRVAMHSQLPD
jgi:cation diffusion facilitator CzcD-associated flavoprotein CzcO